MKASANRLKWWRFWPLFVLVLVVALAKFFNLDAQLSIASIRQNQQWLLGFVDDHWLGAALLYTLGYAAFVSLSVPGAVWLTIAGGLMFGSVCGTLFAAGAATMGATGLFLVARSSFGEPLREQAGPWMSKVQKEFAANEWSFLFLLRLAPVIPFFIANLIPSVLGVKLARYILTTLLGILPATAIYSSIGAGIGTTLDPTIGPETGFVLSGQLKLALAGLMVLALIPIVVRYLRRMR